MDSQNMSKIRSANYLDSGSKNMHLSLILERPQPSFIEENES